MNSNFPLLLELENLDGGKKIFFASDFHLGTPNEKSSLEREKLIVKWLEDIKSQASHIFLLGDIFDFWFEYKHCIPKGFHLFKAKITELREAGIPIYFFTGNHDMWMFDYFPKEYGIPVLRKNQILKVADKKLLIGHGDGLGPGDRFYKFLKAFFANKICQFLFEWIHPNLGMALGKFWSGRSRLANSKNDESFHEEDERLLHYCINTLKKNQFDYFVFGHRHLPLDLKISDESRYINLGEWVNHFTFATFDGIEMELKSYAGKNDLIIRKDFSQR
ncbi:UDP-2,3-diacylglucosamine diphosphatase [Hyphobacterium sp. CCMP332]|nr:UDP-2,3-diacylglucosamine diphosphatase [Hyphobacterium sp. CCMP332]